MNQQTLYKEALDNAVASVEMEGYDVTNAQKEICLDFLNGILDKKAFIKVLLEGSHI